MAGFVSSTLKDLLEESDGLDSLTQRQRDILSDISRGLTNKNISAKYGIAVPTVKEHIRIIFDKLHVSNRAEAASFAVKRRLL